MIDLKNKNLFFCRDTDIFTQLLVDAIMKKTKIDKDNFIIIFFPSDNNNSKFKKNIDVKCIEYSGEYLSNILDAKTLTFMSLNNWNASIIKDIIDHNKNILNKLYIYITDDELDRWYKEYRKNGFLQENVSMHLSGSILNILSKQNNFIVPRQYFFEKLSTVLERKDLNIVDASVIFDILYTEESNRLNKIIDAEHKKRKKPEKILIGTKQNSFGYKETIKILYSFYKSGLIDNYSFVCLNSIKHRVPLRIFQAYIRIIKKENLRLEFFPQMEPLVYSSMIAMNSYMILQDRGGASSARVFLKWGCGKLFIRSGSENAKFFRDVYKVDFITFNNKFEIARNIEDYEINITKNKDNILEEEFRSVKALADLYT